MSDDQGRFPTIDVVRRGRQITDILIDRKRIRGVRSASVEQNVGDTTVLKLEIVVGEIIFREDTSDPLQKLIANIEVDEKKLREQLGLPSRDRPPETPPPAVGPEVG